MKKKDKVLELIIYEDGSFKVEDFKNNNKFEGKTHPVAILGAFLTLALGSIGSK